MKSMKAIVKTKEGPGNVAYGNACARGKRK